MRITLHGRAAAEQGEAVDRKLPLRQRFGLRVHLMLCKWCRRYGKQITFLRDAAHVTDWRVESDAWSGLGVVALLLVLESRTKSAGPIAWFAGAIALLTFLAWRVAFPPAFSVEPDDQYVSFEFRDVGMAQAFRRLNPRCQASGSLTSA